MSADPEGPPLICYDGSEDAKHAIRRAAGLLLSKHALVLTVWQPTAAVGSFVWSGAMTPMVDFAELDRAATEDAGRVAEDGAGIARDAGLQAEVLAVKSTEAVWKTIVEVADAHDAAVIVMGSRGLTGVHSALLGSVSTTVMHHTQRPTLVIHCPTGHSTSGG
jgi:nucleotide-binding universal stress UspA family protein